jgi:hypothetical protein
MVRVTELVLFAFSEMVIEVGEVTAVIVAPPGMWFPVTVAPTSKAAVKFAPGQLIVGESLVKLQLTDIPDVAIVSCAGEAAVLEAFCSHFNNTSVATPSCACTKASCVPSSESVTEVLIVPPFVLYAQYTEGIVVPQPEYTLL